jgi:hypothetical protein
VKIEQVSLVIPHQANRRIIVALADRLGVSMDKVVVNVEKYGTRPPHRSRLRSTKPNDKAAFTRSDIVLLNAFGAGFAWGAAGSAVLAFPSLDPCLDFLSILSDYLLFDIGAVFLQLELCSTR